MSAGPNTVTRKSNRRKERSEDGRTVSVPVNYRVGDSGVKLSALSLAWGAGYFMCVATLLEASDTFAQLAHMDQSIFTMT